MTNPTPLSPEREQEIRDSIPTVYAPPWTVHPDMNDDVWRVKYATDHPLAGLVCELPDYGSHLAEFIATARAAVPELLAEIERLRAELAAATEFRLAPAPPAYTPLIVRRDAAYDGTRWAVLHDPGDVAVRRIWTPEGWEMASVSTHEEIYCWPDAAAALAAARRCQAEDEAAEPDVDGVGRTPESYRDQVAPAEACAKCRRPFDPADTSFDGHARYRETAYCRGCVDRCHDNEIADHRCVICA